MVANSWAPIIPLVRLLKWHKISRKSAKLRMIGRPLYPHVNVGFRSIGRRI